MIILASGSPRRREILSDLGAEIKIITADVDESSNESDPERLAEALAIKKGQAVYKKLISEASSDASLPIISADTVVFCDGEILGKPNDRADAENMLRRLSGKKHTVYTGVCVMDGEKCERLVSAAEVEFYPLDDALIEWYLDTNEPYDKAGAYGIQGKGSVLVKKIDGDYFTVMGLPCAEVFRALKKFQILPE